MEDRFVDAGKGGFEGEVQAEAGGHREGEWVGCEAGREVRLIKKISMCGRKTCKHGSRGRETALAWSQFGCGKIRQRIGCKGGFKTLFSILSFLDVGTS